MTVRAWVLAFVAVCVAFAFEEFVLIRPLSSVSQSDPVSRRLGLLALWWPAIGIAATGSFIGGFASVRLGGALNAVGVVLCIAGVALRFWSRRTRRRLAAPGVVRDGPYRFVRHPGYLGLLLFYIGLPLVLGSALGFVVLSVPSIVIFVALIGAEDRRMEKEWGEEYARYESQHARLVPGLW